MVRVHCGALPSPLLPARRYDDAFVSACVRQCEQEVRKCNRQDWYRTKPRIHPNAKVRHGPRDECCAGRDNGHQPEQCSQAELNRPGGRHGLFCCARNTCGGGKTPYCSSHCRLILCWLCSVCHVSYFVQPTHSSGGKTASTISSVRSRNRMP